jgi:Ca-activated chloride channel family protein
VRGSEFSMTIFPIPAKGSRKVVLAYDEALQADDGALRYVLPLSLGAERAVPIDALAISVEVVGEHGAPPADVVTPGWVTHASASADRVHFDVAAMSAVPEKDFVVQLAAPAAHEARVVTFEEAGERTFAARVVVPADLAAVSIDRGSGDRVIVIDTSDSQSKETLRAQARVAASIVGSMDPRGHFAVLACDSACEAFPAEGVAAAESVASLEAWLEALAPHGSSDLSGAIQEGARRVEDGKPAQLVLLHDGNASAGELSTQAIAASVAPVLAPKRVDLRFFGAGRSLDEVALRGLSRALGAAYEPLAGSGSLEDRIAEIGRGLDRPLLVSPRIELPAGFAEVRPSALQSLRLGETIRLVGKDGSGPVSGNARVTGQIEGVPVEVEVPISIATDARPNPLLPRLWAEREVDELDAAGGPEARARIVALSRKAHVLSRYTSLLVLENERMFAEFGVARTTRRASDQSDHGFGAPEDAAASASALGSGSPLADLSAGVGSGHGRLGGAHVARPPQIRIGTTTISGRLPAEAIQRIIRLQVGRFRACYERGLMKNPTLAGRVVTRFVIDRAGQVVNATNAGSDLPDPEVVACVVRGFYSLDFPEPEGGIVTVTYPFVFSSDGTRPKAPVTLWPDQPYVHREPTPRATSEYGGSDRWRGGFRGGPRVTLRVEHLAADERWREARGDELRAIERAVADAPTSRAKRDRWVRALVQAGRFERAREEAAQFVELDPDLALARELLAQTEAVLGDERAALAEVDALVEANARSANAHLRAVRAFAASGDARRACAHLRSIAEIEGTREARARAEACAEHGSMGAATKGAFEVRVECDDATVACPEVAVVTSSGRVVSRAAPFDGIPEDTGLTLLSAGAGTYRTLLLGGDPRARGRVRLEVHGKRAVFPFEGGQIRTVATTRIEEKRTWEPWVWVTM